MTQAVITVIGKRDLWQIAVEHIQKNLIRPYRIGLRNIVLKSTDLVEIAIAQCRYRHTAPKPDQSHSHAAPPSPATA